MNIKELSNDIAVKAKDKILEGQTKDLAKQLSMDYLYRNISYFLLGFFVIFAFFLSLAAASFDLMKVFSAQFWIDFCVTMIPAVILKYTFGKYGSFEGHKNDDVRKAVKDVEDVNARVTDEQLIDELHLYIDDYNYQNKLIALKKQVYFAAYKKPKSKKLQLQKECIRMLEELQESRDMTAKRHNEITTFLYSSNFNIDSFKVNYKRISESSLKTGLPSKPQDDNDLSYSEAYELFGKTAVLYLFTTAFSILMAISNLAFDELSLRTIIIFVSRIGVYISNAYMGFILGKNAIETVKLKVLYAIHRFLERFIELHRKDEVVN